MERAAMIVLAAGLAVCGRAAADDLGPNVTPRGSLDNSRIRFERDKKGHVAFIGGSITEMNGYRPMVCEYLKKRFPETKFDFTDAGISSTCSTTGAFRLASDVLSKGPLDMLFVEFAVNDDQDAGHTAEACIRGMEGLVRLARRHNPRCDIVVTYFVTPGMLAQLQAGAEPLSMAAHEKVTVHYLLPRIHLAREVARRITAGELTWKQFGGTHPGPAGNRICADMIAKLLDQAWSAPLPAGAKPVDHPTPEKPLDAMCYQRGRFVDPAKAKIESGWVLGVPKWKQLKGSCRSRFAQAPLLSAETPGATLTLEFTGTAVGAYVLAGPDAGTVEASVDGGPARKVDLYHRFSRGLHYPRTVMLAADLADGKHTLALRLSAERNKSSLATAARVLQFVAN